MSELVKKIFFFLRTTEKLVIHRAIAHGTKRGMTYQYYSESPDKDRAFLNLAELCKADDEFTLTNVTGYPHEVKFKKWIWEK